MKTLVLTKDMKAPLRETVLDMLVEFHAHSRKDGAGARDDSAQARERAGEFLDRLLDDGNATRLLVGLDDAGRGEGFILFMVCAGYGSDWIWICEVFAHGAKGPRGNVARGLCQAIGEWGRGNGMKSIVAMAGKEDEDVLKLVREFGMKTKPQLWLSLDL